MDSVLDGKKHITKLDAVRGVAALMVAGYHSGSPIIAETEFAIFLNKLSKYIFDGRTGVCIFFVLSGLVLGLSLKRMTSITFSGYAYFLWRRVCRLFPAYFICTIPYLILYLYITLSSSNAQQPAGWFYFYKKLNLGAFELFKNFCFLNQSLNMVTWTLKVEMQAALFIPLMHIISYIYGGKFRIPLLLILVTLSFLSTGHTRIYLYLFYLGYLTPFVLLKLKEISEIPAMSSILFLFGALLLVISHNMGKTGFEEHVAILLIAFGSSALLLSVLYSPETKLLSWLDLGIFRHLGKVSYSFYLLHLLCLDFTLRMIPRTLFPFAIFVISTTACVLLATLSFRYVESNGIRLSNWIGSKMKSREKLHAS